MADLTKMTDAELTAYAGSGQEAHQKVAVEVARRMREAVEDFSATAKRQTRWMIALTIVIAVLTLVLVILALPDAIKKIAALMCS